ncbi:MAG: 2OG-Fe(II) oxygenase [Bacteroidia bacterium]
MENNFDNLADSLADKAWAISKNFLSNEILDELLDDQKNNFSEGHFKQASIGKGSDKKIISEIRNDFIFWMDEFQLSAPQKKYWDQMEELRKHLNRALFIGVNKLEAHHAIYPKNSFYKKHLDCFSNDDARVISCVLYLNKDWKPSDGGYLRMYESEEKYTDIAPEYGTFVCFISNKIPHEVLISNENRHSITAWFKR